MHQKHDGVREQKEKILSGRRWERSEKIGSKRLGLRRTPHSGAGHLVKGDALGDEVMAEVKSSSSKTKERGYYITVHREWFDKAKKQATMQGRTPIIVLALGYPMEFFSYTPTLCDPPPESITFNKSTRLYLADLCKGKPSAIFFGNEVWVWSIVG